MKKTIGIAIFVFAFGLILIGGQKWLQTRDVKSVVEQFFTAMEKGNNATAQLLLSHELRDSAELQLRKEEKSDSDSEFGVTHTIQEAKVSGNHAVVNVVIEKQGFVLKPIVHLEKSSTNVWKITKIKNLVEDPLWKDIKQAQARQQDNQLAEDVQKAFADRSSVSVESRE